jgi:glycosyltransferase involved in cell wall biosynthesis
LFRYGNLIDAAHFVEPALRPVPIGDFPSGPFLLCIARLELVKKVDDVIRVMAAVKTRGFKGKVLVVGDGRERKNLENFAKQLGVSEDVVFCGNRDQSWLASAIPRAQVVLSPHTGRALAEAALGGAPIVAYDIDWQPELVESGVTGEIVPFGDWQQFSRCVTKLLEDKVYSRAVGQNAREKALEMMDPGRLNAHERQQYDLLISTRTARA